MFSRINGQLCNTNYKQNSGLTSELLLTVALRKGYTER